jgi:glycosyltransferase involved in cell wall biosynthesis
MQRIKGFEQFVKSLPYIEDNIKIFFLGSEYNHSISRLDKIFLFLDPYLWRIEDLISKLKKSDKIIYIGFTNNIFNYYYKSLAVISPFSKPHASLPILEAFSLGKPVIVSDIEGMNELVSEKNGIFFKNNNHRALAEAINKMSQLGNTEYEILCKNAKNTYTEINSNNESIQVIIDNLY